MTAFVLLTDGVTAGPDVGNYLGKKNIQCCPGKKPLRLQAQLCPRPSSCCIYVRDMHSDPFKVGQGAERGMYVVECRSNKM